MSNVLNLWPNFLRLPRPFSPEPSFGMILAPRFKITSSKSLYFTAVRVLQLLTFFIVLIDSIDHNF